MERVVPVGKSGLDVAALLLKVIDMRRRERKNDGRWVFGNEMRVKREKRVYGVMEVRKRMQSMRHEAFELKQQTPPK